MGSVGENYQAGFAFGTIDRWLVTGDLWLVLFHSVSHSMHSSQNMGIQHFNSRSSSS